MPNGVLECQAGFGDDIPSREQRRDALLVGPGRGWSGFIATSAERRALSTLASGAEPPSPDQQGVRLY